MGHVACMGDMRNAYNIKLENLKGIQKYDGRVWIGFICLRIGTSGKSL
jgi:hypothetical protein